MDDWARQKVRELLRDAAVAMYVEAVLALWLGLA